MALQIFIRREVPGASGTLASVASVRSPDLPAHLAHAFGSSFWWAFALAGTALIPILLLRDAAPPPRQ